MAKIVRAGHLAPWLFLVNVPGSGADDRGDVYWHNPAETLYLLAEAAPLLSPESRKALTEYLRAEREGFPPEKQRSVPFAEGARREFCEPAKALLKKWEEKNLGYLTKSPPDIWSLYGLARYYELIGEKPTGEVMACCREIVARSLEHRDWATLYWRRGHTPAFNAVHGVNQLFAGLIGYIRLARLAGDKEAENLGLGPFRPNRGPPLCDGQVHAVHARCPSVQRLLRPPSPAGGSRARRPRTSIIKVETDPGPLHAARRPGLVGETPCGRLARRVGHLELVPSDRRRAPGPSPGRDGRGRLGVVRHRLLRHGPEAGCQRRKGLLVHASGALPAPVPRHGAGAWDASWPTI